mmetsp:Transcript_80834/g.152778  ORF Transcript_80834/g.152778 Transcript_80834/m.152778 type:complete len:259 (-) Transcript_80834:89-865(-)
MLLSPEMLMVTGPPPQSVLNQRPLWLGLMAFLGTTLLLRVIALDILGSLLCGLMICLAAVVIRDGMRELPKFSLMFGLLCGINCIFYAIPVLGSVVSGRSERRVDPVDSSTYHDTSGHMQRLTYTLTVRTSAFFDLNRGFMYNVQSAGELMMPMAMLLGTYLGFTAHNEFQNHMSEYLLDDEEDEHAALRASDGEVEAIAALDRAATDRQGPFASTNRLVGPRQDLAADYGSLDARMGRAPRPAIPRAFQGTSHKLAP